MSDEIVRLRERVAKLESRLEIDAAWQCTGDSTELVRIEIPPEERDSFPDGISARDATIKLQGERIARLSEENEKLREDLLRMSNICGGETEESKIDKQIQDISVSILINSEIEVESHNEAVLVKLCELRGIPIKYKNSLRDIERDYKIYCEEHQIEDRQMKKEDPS